MKERFDATAVRSHFDSIAREYDNYKKRNSYYHHSLIGLIRELVEGDSDISVTELGCGSGDVLAEIQAHRAFGIDLSPAMLKNAALKHKEIPFVSADLASLPFADGMGLGDYAVLADVLEHLPDQDAALREIRRVMKPEEKLIVSWANPLWEPILHFLERLGKKMPEGPHNWIRMRKLKKMASDSGFRAVDSGFRLIVPARIPVVAAFLNRIVPAIPGLRRLCLIQYVILTPE